MKQGGAKSILNLQVGMIKRTVLNAFTGILIIFIVFMLVTYYQAYQSARVAVLYADSLIPAIDEFRERNGKYPDALSELASFASDRPPELIYHAEGSKSYTILIKYPGRFFSCKKWASDNRKWSDGFQETCYR